MEARARLLPRALSRQQVLREELWTEPDAPRFHSVDYRGNRAAHFNVLRPHTSLRIRSEIEVETLPTQALSVAGGSGEPGGRALRVPVGGGAAHDLRSSCSRRPDGTARGLGRPGLGCGAASAGGGLCARLPGCALGVPEQEPALRPGDHQYLGPQASLHGNHAWTGAYLPELGWVGWDPANGIRVGEAHVQVTAGRDFVDVSPVRGYYRGPAGADQEVHLEMEEMAQRSGGCGPARRDLGLRVEKG